jgi:hypothetical protein
MHNNHDMLHTFDDFLSEHDAATSGLSIEGAMTLFSYQSDLTMSETIALGEQVTYIAASLFADFWAANEELSLEDALESFCEGMRFSPDFTGKLVNDLIEAADEDEDIGDVEEGSQDEIEARVRVFLAKLFGNVPDSMKDYADLKLKLAPQLYGNGPWDGGVKVFDRRAHRFGHSYADQQADRRERIPSIYQSDAVTAAISEDYLSQPSGAAGDPGSGWIDSSLATAGHYADKIPDGTSAKNVAGLKGEGGKPFKHGVKLPHAAVGHAERFASEHGFGIRHSGVVGNFAHITTEHPEHADAIADHCGEQFGRLAVSRFTVTPAAKSLELYHRSPLAQGVDKPQSFQTKRRMTEAVAFMERDKPNTYDTTVQTVRDQVEADKQKQKQQHPDTDAEAYEPTIR